MPRPGGAGAVAPKMAIAPLPVRALGALIDVGVVALGVVGTAVLWAVTAGRVSDALTAAVLVVFAVLLAIGYPVACETITDGRSLGKIMLGLRVVCDDGRPEGLRQALYRALAGVLEIWALAGMPALACTLLEPHGRRLGDLLAGTVVISERRDRTPVAPPPIPVPPMPPTLAWWASSLQLSALRAATAESARQFLYRAPQLPPHAREMTAYAVSGAVLAQIAPPPPPGTPPELILVAVLAERERRGRTRAGSGGFAPPY